MAADRTGAGGPAQTPGMSHPHRLAPDAAAPRDVDSAAHAHDADEDAPRPSWSRSAGPAAGGSSAWERVPPRGRVLRWRPALLAVTVLLVAAAAWWAVAWLTSPAPPSPAPAAASAEARVEPEAADGPDGANAAPTGAGADAGAGHGPDAPSVASPSDGAGPAAEPSGGSGPVATLLRVHVVGEVERPGVVSLAPGARVADAVRAAGGATREARTERINLAAPLADGRQVLVPSARTPEEDLARVAGGQDGPGGPEGGAAGTAPDAAASAPAGPARAGGSGGAGAGPVDLNAADAVALQTLPGVGPATAEKIIAHRETVGPFTGLQDLDAVPGVGPAALERLRDRVTW